MEECAHPPRDVQGAGTCALASTLLLPEAGEGRGQAGGSVHWRGSSGLLEGWW